jgi:hypothetical protein
MPDNYISLDPALIAAVGAAMVAVIGAVFAGLVKLRSIDKRIIKVDEQLPVIHDAVNSNMDSAQEEIKALNGKVAELVKQRVEEGRPPVRTGAKPKRKARRR